MENINFWCKDCKVDVLTRARTRYLNKIVGRVKEGFCIGCKKLLRRFPDNVQYDKYFKRSREVKIQRKSMKVDLLQINDPLFDLYYPEHKRKQNEEAERKAREEWERKQR